MLSEKPTSITKLPWIEPGISKRGTLMLQTDVGLLSMHEAAVDLGVRPGTFYERYRRVRNHATLTEMNDRLFGC